MSSEAVLTAKMAIDAGACYGSGRVHELVGDGLTFAEIRRLRIPWDDRWWAFAATSKNRPQSASQVALVAAWLAADQTACLTIRRNVESGYIEVAGRVIPSQKED